MIILENVTKEYTSGTPALNGIDLRIEKGEFVFVVGNSGSGKSTLANELEKHLAALGKHTMLLDGDNVRM